jgi:hypothetical protein
MTSSLCGVVKDVIEVTVKNISILNKFLVICWLIKLISAFVYYQRQIALMLYQEEIG